jgi:hypothetical protein
MVLISHSPQPRADYDRMRLAAPKALDLVGGALALAKCPRIKAALMRHGKPYFGRTNPTGEVLAERTQ